MSAFIVSKGHIDAIIDVAMHGPKDCGPKYPGDGWSAPYWHGEEGDTLNPRIDTDQVGTLLWLECQRSVAARYPNDKDGDWPGPIGLRLSDILCYSYDERPRSQRLTAIQALKALDYYEYQSCEHNGWEGSPARAFCDSLRRAIISRLPGYDEADWMID